MKKLVVVGSLVAASLLFGETNVISGTNNNILGIGADSFITGNSNTLWDVNSTMVLGNSNTFETVSGETLTNGSIIGNTNIIDATSSNFSIVGNINTVNLLADSTLTGSNNTATAFLQNSNLMGSYNTLSGYSINDTSITGNNNNISSALVGSSIYGSGNLLSATGSLVTTIYGGGNLVEGTNTTVIGSGNNISGTSSSAVGSGNNISGTSATSFGSYNTISGNNSIAFGDNITITENNVADFGSKVIRTTATPTNDYDLINKIYLDSSLTTTLNTARTYTDTKTSMISTANNTNSFTKVSSVSGNEHGLYVGDTSTVITGGTTSTSLTLDDNGAKFADVGTGGAVKVQGIATGTADTDAANTKQVNDAKSEAQSYADSVGVTTLNSANTYTDTKFASFTGGGVSETVVDNKIEASEKRSMDYTDSKISALESSLTQEYRSATATAIALGVSPILADGNKNAIGVGFGNYEGQSAVAINYIAEIDKNVYFQTGMSLNASARGIKAGVSYGF